MRPKENYISSVCAPSQCPNNPRQPRQLVLTLKQQLQSYEQTAAKRENTMTTRLCTVIQAVNGHPISFWSIMGEGEIFIHQIKLVASTRRGGISCGFYMGVDWCVLAIENESEFAENIYLVCK